MRWFVVYLLIYFFFSLFLPLKHGECEQHCNYYIHCIILCTLFHTWKLKTLLRPLPCSGIKQSSVLLSTEGAMVTVALPMLGGKRTRKWKKGQETTRSKHCEKTKDLQQKERGKRDLWRLWNEKFKTRPRWLAEVSCGSYVLISFFASNEVLAYSWT